MAKATITVQMDEHGRLVVPKPARKKLGVNGESATVECEVRINE